jgi:hypothetical protein
MIMPDDNLTLLMRIRAAHPAWIVTRDEGLPWHAHYQEGTASRDIYAEQLATLETQLDEIDNGVPSARS